MRALISALTMSCCFFAVLPSARAAGNPDLPPRPPFKNVMIIGWDGTRRERLEQLLVEGKLPHLRRFIEKGRYLDIDVTTGKSDTKAGWTQILTGYDPEITGVYDNWKRYRPIPAGYTLPERLTAHFGKNGITTVFLSGKLHNLGTRGSHRLCENCEKDLRMDEDLFADSKVPEKERIIVRFDGEPYRNTKERVDYFENGLGPMTKVGPRVLDYLGRLADKRFFLFVEFEEPDEQGHRYAEGSPEYIKALSGVDGWLGRIEERLGQLNLSAQTLIYVVSDHGFSEGRRNHNDAPHSFLATNDLAVKIGKGDRKDITPTILDRFGIDLSSVTPKLNGRSLLR